jgi:hypothetical protein
MLSPGHQWSIAVGVTSFLGRLEASFLTQLDSKEIPKHLDPKDGETLTAWFHEAFGYWLLQHRDDLLAKQWARKGWAECTLERMPSGELKETYRVKPECVEQINAWLQDEID